MPEPNTQEVKVEKPDYFKSVLSGNIGTTIEEQIKNTKGADLPMASMEALWNDSKVKENYNSKFGDKAFEQFAKDYKITETSYNAYQYAINNKNLKSSLIDNKNKLFEDNKDMSTDFGTVQASETGALHRGDIYTQDLRDPREIALNQNNGWIDDKGQFNEFNTNKDGKRPGFWESLFMSDEETKKFDPTNNPNFVNAQGKQIKSLVYTSGEKLKEAFPNQQFDDLARGVPFIKAVYYGEEIGDQESVSKYDFMGVTDPKLKTSKASSLLSAIPRALYKSASGLESGFANTLIGAADWFDGVDENGYRQWLEGLDANAKQSSISISRESKENMLTFENGVQLPVDIAAQLLLGGASAKGAQTVGELANLVSSTNKLLQAKRAMNLAKTAEEFNEKKAIFDGLWNSADALKIAKAARVTSIGTMATMSVADARDQAIAAGFDQNQAGMFQMTSLVAMLAANRAMSWAEKNVDAVQFKNEIAKLNEDKLAYIAKSMAEAPTEEAKKGVFARGLKTTYDATKNALSKISATKIGSSEYVKEPSEEMLETVGDYASKALANEVYGKSGKEQDGFIGTNDPKYWSQFWADMGMSAAGGVVGAGIAKAGFKLFNKGRDEVSKQSVTNLILTGEGDRYLRMLESLHKNGALGSKNLSTDVDPETGNYKSINATANNLSHNDANYQLLLNEYNTITRVINGLGAKNVYDMVKSNSDFNDKELAGIAIEKTKELTTDYLNIVSKDPSLAEAAIDGVLS